MVNMDAVQRKLFPLDTEDPDGESIRVYYAPELDMAPMPSVSVIKGVRDDPEKDEALAGWRNRFDGESKYGRPWWKDQRQFKAYRGTLVHFTILDALGQQAGIDAGGDTYFHTVGTRDYGWEEYHAEYCLKKWSKQAPSANTDAIAFSPPNNHYDGEHAWDRATRDMQWAAKAFKAVVLDGEYDRDFVSWADEQPTQFRHTGRLSPSNVRDVEAYVFDTEYGYGGQYDLLYEDADGNTVLSDLKTSSAIRFDHKLQAAAYTRAVESTDEYEIDVCEIIRLHPDSETVEISRSPDWDRTVDGLAHQFLGLADKAWGIDYSEVLKRARKALTPEADPVWGDTEDTDTDDSATDASTYERTEQDELPAK